MRFEPITLEKYCWSLGTTSFRVEDLKFNILEQLNLLEQLNNKYPTLNWSEKNSKEKQILYSQLLTSSNLFQITKTLDKDARLKTSSLVELGLVTDQRILTPVGKDLMSLNKKKEADNDIIFDLHKNNNIFDISDDSFIYLKQLLKYQTYKEFKIKPLLTLIYFCSYFDCISYDQFTFIIPLCKSIDETKDAIEFLRRGCHYNEFILNKIKISPMTNKVESIIKEFSPLKADEILNLFPHGKGKSYVKEIPLLYNQFKIYLEKRNTLTPKEKFNLIKEFNFQNFKDKALTETKEFIFGTSVFNSSTNYSEVVKHFDSSLIGTSENLLLNVYILYTFNSYIANLKEYQDLNLRYIALTDIFLISENSIKLDILPKLFFSSIKEHLLNENLILDDIKYSNFLHTNYTFENMYNFFNHDISFIESKIYELYPDFKVKKNFKEDLKLFISQKRKDKFDELIDLKFSKKNLSKLLKYIRDKKLKELQKYGFISNIPTIFEYLVGLSWYSISNKEGNIYNILNLKLDSNLYPLRFASGGQADILYKYNDGHDVIIEVTMTEKENQRKLELEPVTRHLGRYKIDKNKNTYAIFIAPYLDPNVLVSFRSMKILPYYNPHNLNKIDSLKIIPLSIDNLIYILDHDISYDKLKIKFDEFFEESSLNGYEWYENTINTIYKY